MAYAGSFQSMCMHACMLAKTDSTGTKSILSMMLAKQFLGDNNPSCPPKAVCIQAALLLYNTLVLWSLDG